MSRSFHALLLAAALTLQAGLASAQDENLTGLDLATLMTMDVMVTSAAKRAQSTADAAAAVYVITREDIRRSGATSVPDLLRTVPGLQVARVNTRSWAVTARGFNSKFANKLQVLVDGRSIYATIFSGVMWEEQFVAVSEIERIEVIRGPGGALWGINAMNGVINIITRSASSDPGLHASAGGGTDVSEAASLSYAAPLAAGDLRVFLDHYDAERFEGDQNDLERSKVGARFERSLARDHFTVHGEYADAEFGDPLRLTDAALPPGASIGSFSFGWRRTLDGGAQTEMAAYHLSTQREQPNRWEEDATGVDLQHTTARHGRHIVTLGAGFRRLSDEQRDPRAAQSFSRTALEHEQWSVYVQDETYWFEDRLRVIAGAKLEDFEFTGLAFQPTLRALWHANAQHTFWTAASRAARTPSRFELHSALSVPAPIPGPPAYVVITGSEALDVEQLDAYELGWRWRPEQRFTLDLALYRHEYEDLMLQMERPPRFIPGPPPRLLLPVQYANAARSHTYGAELALEWIATDRLRLQASAHRMKIDLPTVTHSLNAVGADPEHAWSVRGRFDLTSALEADVAVRAVGPIDAHGIDGYESVDLRLAWRPRMALELALTVDNLLDDEHVEFFDEVARRPGVTLGRSVFARIGWGVGR